MPAPRKPLATAGGLGDHKRNPSRYAARQTIAEMDVLGAPSDGLSSDEIAAWQSFVASLPGSLTEIDRPSMEVFARLRALSFRPGERLKSGELSLICRLSRELGERAADRPHARVADNVRQFGGLRPATRSA